MSILVSGSIAYDHIMTFPGRFKDHILPDKIHILNVSFILERMNRNFGGTGGNIAYNLSLLGEKPLLFGTVGSDFSDYWTHCHQHGINLTLVKEYDNINTASCFITTDQDDNQITGFYPGAMSKSRTLCIADMPMTDRVELAIIAPDDPPAMIKHCRECQKLGIPFIFDPGQQVIALSKEELLTCGSGSKAIVGNDYEIEMFIRKTKRTIPTLLKNLTQAIIITKGAEGSCVHTRDKNFTIPAVQPKSVIDPTGAGDAFRAGIMKGRLEKLSWEDSLRLANQTAVYAIEHTGTQNHTFTLKDFRARYQTSYRQTCPI